jgi:hypothetical protein
MDAETHELYATQSTVSDPGAAVLSRVPADLDGIRRVARGLVIHFRVGDPLGNGIPEERLGEIDTRYADAMLAQLATLSGCALDEQRPPRERLVGCCRDFTLLFISFARAAGIPVRMRTGFAAYFVKGWAVDHAVAEVWDAAEERWRLVDPELADDHVDPHDGLRVDPLDVPRDRFITAGTAWRDCRAGADDPARFVVDPGLEIPETRGWPQIQFSTVLDLAALNKVEMLMWDGWGLAVRAPGAAELELLDRVAALTASADPPLAELAALYAEPLLRVPETVTSFDPRGGPPREVVLRPSRTIRA